MIRIAAKILAARLPEPLEILLACKGERDDHGKEIDEILDIVDELELIKAKTNEN